VLIRCFLTAAANDESGAAIIAPAIAVYKNGGSLSQLAKYSFKSFDPSGDGSGDRSVAAHPHGMNGMWNA
jgi:hypothetical protein